MRGQAAHTRVLGRGALGAFLLVVLSLAATAAPASARLLDRFVTSGNATARWIEDPSPVPGASDNKAIELTVTARSAIDFNDAAWVTFQGFGPAAPTTPPAFLYKVSEAGPSGGSVRFVMRFSDGGFGFLRPVTVQAGSWQLANGATDDWESTGGQGCASSTSLTYVRMLTCHPNANVTSVEIINDSGWLHAGHPFTALVDYISYGGEVVTVPAPPVLGQSVNASRVAGKVLVRLPKGSPAGGVRSSATAPSDRDTVDGLVQGLPVGTLIDARKGKLKLVTAKGRRKGKQSGRFAGGIFKVTQSKRRKQGGLTTLSLVKASRRRCGSGASSSQTGRPVADASRRRRGLLRRLKAHAKGRFRTRGRYSSAIVEGTTWSISDRCEGTLVRVKRGRVAVRDFRHKRTVHVTTGHSYLAKAPGY